MCCYIRRLQMEYYRYGISFLVGLLISAAVRAVVGGGAKLRRRLRLPPGPRQLPVIGSTGVLLRGLPHRTLRDLSLRHGPLMLLRVCERLVVVVSSAEAAREVYKQKDAAFLDRPRGPAMEEIARQGQGIFLTPYGDHWRTLRRILVAELLSARRVESFRRIRDDEVARLLSSVKAGGQLVNIDQLLGDFMAGSSVRAIFGDRLPEGAVFMKCLRQGLDLTALYDLRDLFPSSPLVRWLVQRWTSGRAERYHQKLYQLMDNILESREERRAARDGDEEQDMVDVLLRIQKEGDMRVPLTQGVIRAMLADVFAAAVDSTTTILQWVMTELMANPRVMQKVQSEIRQKFAGQDKVNEGTLNGRHYLTAVIKETLRLHPPLAVSPRSCLQECKIQGYDVPQGAIVLTNIWAISRDPKYWDEPEKFAPERFERDGAADFKGADFEFTPFGGGRRICPGIGFAHASLESALASLLYHFDWELPTGVAPEEVDMTEVFGITVGKKVELFLCPIPRVPF